jgi:uncharacterized membrane protein YfcA
VSLEPWQWAVIALGAFGTGLSKTGLAGLNILVVALFALVIEPRASVGVVLPVLLSADVVAVSAFQRHADWAHLRRLFPWAAVGVVLGYFAMGQVNDAQVKKLIGGIVLVMLLLHCARRVRESRRKRRAAQDDEPDVEAEEAEIPHRLWFVAGMGMLAGFTTMVANAAGPVMILYLLSAGLPKMAFIGTSAWFFLTVNLFKVPFSVELGLINPAALRLSATLAPFAVAGALLGKAVLRHIPQQLFENLALLMTLIAGLRLLF